MLVRPLVFPDDRPEAMDLVAEVVASDGEPPLSEHKLTAVRDDDGLGVVIEEEQRVQAWAALVPATVAGEYGLEVVIPPDRRSEGVLSALVSGAREVVPVARRLRLWLYRSDLVEAAMAIGFEPERFLLRMERPLPAAIEAPWPQGIEVRGFAVGEDEEAWLAVNNAAFAGHPENGSWEVANLEERMSQAWFDAEGLRMAWDGPELAGFCWTKMHPDSTGEIYVIATSPRSRGRGLGKALAVEGMRYAHELGATAMLLYTEADNPAVRLYESLGFRTRRTHRAFVLDV